jgi:uncharacterized membrane protein
VSDEVLLTLAVVFLISLPVLSLLSLLAISGARREIAVLQAALRELDGKTLALEQAVRNEKGQKAAGESAAPRETPAELRQVPLAAAWAETPSAAMPVTDALPETPAAGNAPPEPAKPLRLEIALRALFEWLLAKGNIWVTGGVALFLLGFGLLFNYVVQKGWFSLELRLAAAAACGAAMTAFGWRMRDRRRTYALILQGGGIGTLYLVLLAGAKLASVIPVSAAVSGMLMLSVFTVLLALYQNSELLALFALLGGYAAPMLVGGGSSGFVAMFSVHALLNLEVLFLSLFRDWGKTRRCGFAASVAAGALWGALRWRASYLSSVEPFLILFLVTYGAVAVSPLYRQSLEKIFRGRKLWPYARLDAPLLMALPFAFLFLQTAAASHTRYGVALSCLALGACCLALANVFRKHEKTFRTGNMREAYLICCIIFSSLAVPFVFQQASAAAIWAVEGAFFTAFAARKKQAAPLGLGFLLHAAAFALYHFAPFMHLPAHLYGVPFRPAGLLDWGAGASPFLLTGLLFAASALASSFFLAKIPAPGQAGAIAVRVLNRGFTFPTGILSLAFAAYGTGWWTLCAWHAAATIFRGSAVTGFALLGFGGVAGYALSSPFRLRPALFSGIPATGTAALPAVRPASGWSAARILALPPVAMACVCGLLEIAAAWRYGYPHTFLSAVFPADLWRNRTLNWIVLAVLFATGTLLRDADTLPRRAAWGGLLFAFLLYTSLAAMRGASETLPAGWNMPGGIGYLAAFLPTSVATALLTGKKTGMPPGRGSCRNAGLIVLGAMMLLQLPLFLQCFLEEGDWPIRYIPLLNTLEMWQFLYLAAAAMLFRAAPGARLGKAGIHYALPAAAFLWVNSMAARAAWHYFGERIMPGFLAGFIPDAPYFQGILAMLWGLAALVLVFFGGKKYGSRVLWFLGAGLIALDIAKVMMIDMRNAATMVRIFAVLLLGGLFLFIGWMSPLPPRKEDADEKCPRS